MEGPQGCSLSPLVPGVSPLARQVFNEFLKISPCLDSFLAYDDLLDLVTEAEDAVKDYLVPTHLEQLIEYLLTMPPDGASADRSFKFPFVTSRLLSRFLSVLDEINESEERILQILQVLKQPPPINGMISMYFTDLSENLLGRDKNLLKVLLSQEQEFVFDHLGNRNLNSFFINVLNKCCKSKKYFGFMEKFVKSLLDRIGSEECCGNSQEIICACIGEDAIYSVVKGEIQRFFQGYEENSQKVWGSKIKMIRAVLEKEKDLKFMDEECWGSPGTVEIIEKHAEEYVKWLETGKNSWISTSMGFAIQKIGQNVISAVEVIALFADMRQNSINQLIKSQKLLEKVLNLYETHQWSSIFHNIFINFAITLLSSDLASDFSSLLLHFLTKNCLFPPTPLKSLSFLASCYKTGSILLNSSKTNTIVEEALNTDSSWPVLEQHLLEKLTINNQNSLSTRELKPYSRSKDPSYPKSSAGEQGLLSSQDLKSFRSLPKLSEKKSLGKMLPKVIFIEKEKLYEENLNLKQQFHVLKDENMKLKTKLERTKRKAEDAKTPNGLPKTQNLIEKLKSSVKDLKSEVQAKDKEINDLRKNIKFTKIEKLEEDVQHYAGECDRLRFTLQELSLKPSENSNLDKKQKENHLLHNEIQSYAKSNQNEVPNSEPDSPPKDSSLKAKLKSLEAELDSKTLQISSLQQEIKRLHASANPNVVISPKNCAVLTKMVDFFCKSAIDPKVWIKSVTNKAELTKHQLAQALLQDSVECSEGEISDFFAKFAQGESQIPAAQLVAIFSEYEYSQHSLEDLFEMFKARCTILRVGCIKKYLNSVWVGERVDEEAVKALFNTEIFKLYSKAEENIVKRYFFEGLTSISKSKAILKVLLQFDDWRPVDIAHLTAYFNETQKKITLNYETTLSTFHQDSHYQHTMSLIQFLDELASLSYLTNDTERSCARVAVFFHENSVNQINYLKVLTMFRDMTFRKDFIQNFEHEIDLSGYSDEN